MNGKIKPLKKDIIGFKKVFDEKNGDYYIVEMLIEKGTRVFSRGNLGPRAHAKARAEKACVLAIYETNGKHRQSYRKYSHFKWNHEIKLSKRKRIIHQGGWGPDTSYHVGKEVFPNDFAEYNEQCAEGIHFYTNPDRACRH